MAASKMSSLTTRVCFLLTLTILTKADEDGRHTLGAPCEGSCPGIVGGRCHQGRCSCLPYYAEYNSTTCIQSTLLGYDCFVDEQCGLKVAHSGCLDGVCRCKEGYLQFRKHTCLGPAHLGQVCYSNAHCRLWDNDSRCDFLIPNLFGRCGCNAPLKPVADKCTEEFSINNHLSDQSSDQSVPTTDNSAANSVTPQETAASTNQPQIYTSQSEATPQMSVSALATSINQYPVSEVVKLPTFENDIDTEKTHESFLLFNRETLSTTERYIPNIALSHPGKHGYDSMLKLIADDLNFDDIDSNAQPSYSITRNPTTLNHTRTTLSQPVAAHKTLSATTNVIKKPYYKKHGYRVRYEVGALSLGLPCAADQQCKEADINSRCISGRCDCLYKGNATSHCSASNTGCLPGTFQCRSTGACISWFFICDGRVDCADGSDEECAGARCPIGSLRCGISRRRRPGSWRNPSRCIPRSARCDGKRDCPNGEDERNCKATLKRRCPKYTFQCENGKCLPEYEFCNAILSCGDGSDEPSHLCNENTSPEESKQCPLRCANGRCRSTAIACSGKDGCGDNSDEVACTVCKCPAVPQ